jgi:hypothetical protein
MNNALRQDTSTRTAGGGNRGLGDKRVRWKEARYGGRM